MAKHIANSSVHLEVVVAAPEQKPILANLLELYIHDFSEYLNLAVGEDGRFGYTNLLLYWSEPDRHPFLVRVDSKWAGFALVKGGSEVSGKKTVWDMAEFFIIRGYRRRGVGTQIAHDVWRRFPGAWEVRVMQSNLSACHFWAHAVAKFTGKVIHPVRIEKDGRRWELFSFESHA